MKFSWREGARAGDAGTVLTGAAASMATLSEGTAHHTDDDFEAARLRTRSALDELAARWRHVPHPADGEGIEASVAGAAARAATSEAELSREGFAWSRTAGLSYVLPGEALRGAYAHAVRSVGIQSVGRSIQCSVASIRLRQAARKPPPAFYGLAFVATMSSYEGQCCEQSLVDIGDNICLCGFVGVS